MEALFKIDRFELPHIIVCMLLASFWLTLMMSLFIFYKGVEHMEIQNYFNHRFIAKQNELEKRIDEITIFLKSPSQKKTD
jgi:hypothetical protein